MASATGLAVGRAAAGRAALRRWALGATDGVALRTGLYLAQAGEFGFVLLTLAQNNKLVPASLLNPVLAAMVLSMLATPFIIMGSNRIVMQLVSSEWLQASLQLTRIARQAMKIAAELCVYTNEELTVESIDL